MPPHARPALLAPAVLAALLAPAALAAPLALAVRPASGAPAPSLRDDPAGAAAALAAARDRAARAGAAVDDLKRELGPGHLTDPMPEVDRAYGLAALRSDYADAQRRAAGYRATLGDQHPTLLATEQLLDGLRGQLLDGTRRALSAAERDAADARSEAAAAERRLAGAAPSAADRTGSIAAPPAIPAPRLAASPLALSPAAPPRPAPAASGAADEPDAAPERAASSGRTAAGALAAAVLAALTAGLAALHLLRPRRPRAAPAAPRRVEPALAASPKVEPELVPAIPTAPAPVPAPAVPVLHALPLSADVRAGGLAEAAAALHGTLRAAFASEGRMTVLVAPAAGLPGPDADAAALGLALAAAAAGRRALLMEARGAGRLRGALVPAGADPVLAEAGGAVRTLYRLGRGEDVCALLPSDGGEAEAALAAAGRPGTPRLRGLDGFDTVVLVGDDAAALAASADLVVLAAPPGTSPAALAAAALPLRAAGRPCGAVLVERVAEAATAAPPPRAVPRRRPVADFAARPSGVPWAHPRIPAHPCEETRPDRVGESARSGLGLRGSIEPALRRVG